MHMGMHMGVHVQVTAHRTCCGALLNHDCCCPPVYRVTSERVLFTEWDWWHPLDEPVGLVCCPCLSVLYVLRALARDFCCAIGASSAAAESLYKNQLRNQRDVASTYKYQKNKLPRSTRFKNFGHRSN